MAIRVGGDQVSTAYKYGEYQLADHLQRGVINDFDLARANQIYQAVASNPPPNYGPYNDFASQQRWQAEVDSAQNLYATAARIHNFQDPRVLAGANEQQNIAFGGGGWRPQGPVYYPPPQQPVYYPGQQPVYYPGMERNRHANRDAAIAGVAVGALVGLTVWAAMRNNRNYYG